MKKSNKKREVLNKNEDFYSYYAVIIVIVFIAFIPSLNNGFTNWDDDIYVTENWKIKALNWNNIKHIFTTTHFGGYEPLTELAFAIQYKFFKYNAKIYHLNNLILHIVNCLLVFYLVYLFSQRKEVAFITAILFGIHPMHVESVAWISELKDVLFTLFFLISLINYIFYLTKKDKKYYYVSLVSFIICLLPKAQSLLFPFVLILTDYFYNRKINWKSLKEKIPFFIVSGIFFVILYIGAKETRQIGDESVTSLFHNFLYANFGIVFYIIRFFLPFGLSNCYPLPDKSGDLFFLSLYYSAPFIVASLVVLLFFLRKNKKVIFAFLFYFINLFIVLQLKRTNVTVVADRYTYVPYIGFLYFFADYFVNLYDKAKEKQYLKITFIALFSVLVVFFSFLTWQRCKVWFDSITLWSDTIKKYPNTPVAHNHFAVALQMEKKDYEKAVYHFKKAMELDPLYFAPYNNLGTLYHDRKEYIKAIEIFNNGLKLNKNIRQLYYNIGLSYHEMGELEKALEYYKKAIQSMKNYLAPYNNIARILMEYGRYEEAESYLKDALRYNPNYLYAYVTYSDLMIKQGRFKEAADYLAKAESILESSTLVKYKKAALYNKLKDYAKAINILERLKAELPNDILILVELARAYYFINDMEKFNQCVKNIEELDLNNKEYLTLKKEIKSF